MAICRRCGKEFDPDEARSEFANDDWVTERNLAGYYDDYPGLCFNCAFEVVSADYNTGAEIMSMMGDND